jgi:hypothetical protein
MASRSSRKLGFVAQRKFLTMTGLEMLRSEVA